MPGTYNKSTIVSVFVRAAMREANPKDFLLGLLLGNFTTITTADATVLTSTTTGGSSANWTLPPGMDRMSITEIAELALRNLETGIDEPPCYGPNGERIDRRVRQVPPSQRIISYGQFGGISR